jgi:hypothetical protein
VSVFSELGTRFKSLFGNTKRLRNDLNDAVLRIQALEVQRKLLGGTSNPEGLAIGAPLVMVQIIGGTSGPENVWTGRRVRVVDGTDTPGVPFFQAKYIVDDDDTMLYKIQQTPTGGGIFLGAFCLVRLSFVLNDHAYYHVVDGESQGFLAQISDVPDVNGEYPWTQANAHPDNAKSDVALDPAGVAYGKCWWSSWKAADTAITEREVFAVGTGVFLRAGYSGLGATFWFSGFADAEHEACP